MGLRLIRVGLAVGDIEAATLFYRALTGMPGRRVTPGRHHFPLGSTVLELYDPRAEGDEFDSRPNADHVYFAVDDLDGLFHRAQSMGFGDIDDHLGEADTGERAFYAADPWGNPLCFVDAGGPIGG